MFNAFAEICKANNVDTIDAATYYLENYKNNNEFPCGFHNGVPSQGHWNSAGHRLTAKAIIDYIRQNKNAFFSN